MKFIERKLSWVKRRPVEIKLDVLKFEVKNFNKIDNSECLIDLYYNDGTSSLDVICRVNVAELFINGIKTQGKWTGGTLNLKDSFMFELVE